MKRYLIIVLTILCSNLFALQYNIENVKYVVMIPQYIQPLKYSEYGNEIKETQLITELSEQINDINSCYINTEKRGKLQINSINGERNVVSPKCLVDILNVFKKGYYKRQYVYTQQELFEKNITMIVLLNRYKSLSSTINNELLNIKSQSEKI